MRKGVAYMFRYRQVSMQANSRYLEALAVVDDPTKAKHDLDRMTTRKKDAAGRGCSAFNPLARRDAELFHSMMDGAITAPARIREPRYPPTARLHPSFAALHQRSPKSPSSKVSRILRRFHAHGLIAKIPRTRRWRVTVYGTPCHGHCPLFTQS
jgi:hypothetical protein